MLSPNLSIRRSLNHLCIRSWFWLLPTSLASVVIALFSDYGRTELRFDPILIQSGQYWRLITGHLTHLNFIHLVINLLGLLTIHFIFVNNWQTDDKRFAPLSLMLILSGLFFIYYPHLQWYVGLSGLLHGLWLIGAYRSGGLFGLTACTLLIIKIMLEYFDYNQSSRILIDQIIFTPAHYLGALSGIIYLIMIQVKSILYKLLQRTSN